MSLLAALAIAVPLTVPPPPPTTGFEHLGELVLSSTESDVPPELLERVVALVDRPLAGLEIRVRHGVLHPPGQDDESTTVRLVDVRLDTSDDERLATLFDTSRLLDVVLVGESTRSRDELGVWRQFLKAAKRAGRHVQVRVVPSHEDGTVPEATVEALQRLRLTMNRVSMLVEQLATRLDVGEAMPPAWVATLTREFRSLGESREQMAPILGSEGADRFGVLASDAGDFFETLEDRVRTEDAESIRAFVRSEIRAGLCTSCHDTRTPDTDERWWDAVPERMAALGLPRTPLRVGIDVPVAWGDDGVRSQVIADALLVALSTHEALRESLGQ